MILYPEHKSIKHRIPCICSSKHQWNSQTTGCGGWSPEPSTLQPTKIIPLIKPKPFDQRPVANCQKQSTKYMLRQKDHDFQNSWAVVFTFSFYIQLNININLCRHCWSGATSGYSRIFFEKKSFQFYFWCELFPKVSSYGLEQWSWAINMSKFLAEVLNKAKTNECKSLSLFPMLALLLLEAKANRRHFAEDLISLVC